MGEFSNDDAIQLAQPDRIIIDVGVYQFHGKIIGKNFSPMELTIKHTGIKLKFKLPKKFKFSILANETSIEKHATLSDSTKDKTITISVDKNEKGSYDFSVIKVEPFNKKYGELFINKGKQTEIEYS